MRRQRVDSNSAKRVGHSCPVAAADLATTMHRRASVRFDPLTGRLPRERRSPTCRCPMTWPVGRRAADPQRDLRGHHELTIAAPSPGT